jgi:voltage-gated potassium channel
VRRTIDRFLENPASIRFAAWLIMTATVLSVVLGGVVVWLLDHREYPNLGRAFWFTLQTVTTVGYGDVTPGSPVGRVVGALVMLTGIGFITIVTAAITSTFVEAARKTSDTAAESAEAESARRTEDALTEITARLERIEETLRRMAKEGPG